MSAAARKLEEAQFFLDRLRSALIPKAFHIHNAGHLRLNIRVNAGLTTRLPINEKEAGYYLSAFLSAARSVTFALQAEGKEAYDTVFSGWFGRLTSAQKDLFKQMNEDRVEEVHKTGARKENIEKKLIVKNKTTSDAVIAWPVLHFSSTSKEVLDSAKEYLGLLNDLVAAVEPRIGD